MYPSAIARRKNWPAGGYAAVNILSGHLETASAAWRAYRAPTPQDWFDLLGKDLSVLPQLRQTVLEMLEEFPGRVGTRATETRIWS